MQRFFVFLSVLFYANFAYGDYISSDVPNGCVENMSPVFIAFYEVNQYTCLNGYYLPADAVECVPCLSGHKCDGGTFLFNETMDQGIEYKLPINEMVVGGCDNALVLDGSLVAMFVLSEYTCPVGYYLPADAIQCVICPANSRCVGGKYTYNETTDQGIERCPIGHSSSAGAAACTANTITINWEGAESGQCTYDTTISVPNTPPTRRGYVFDGWKIKID